MNSIAAIDGTANSLPAISSPRCSPGVPHQVAGRDNHLRVRQLRWTSSQNAAARRGMEPRLHQAAHARRECGVRRRGTGHYSATISRGQWLHPGADDPRPDVEKGKSLHELLKRCAKCSLRRINTGSRTWTSPRRRSRRSLRDGNLRARQGVAEYRIGTSTTPVEHRAAVHTISGLTPRSWKSAATRSAGVIRS